MSSKKGSQGLLQQWVNNQSEQLNLEIIKSSLKLLNEIQESQEITWISPLKEENYKEYRDDFLQALGMEELNVSREIWPKGGPVWDGLAITKDGDGEQIVLLIEAKAHLGEMKSQLRATSSDSIRIIKETFKKFRVKYQIDESVSSIWEQEYYQLANRLIYLDYLNHTLGIKTYLILINFIDDQTNKPTPLKEYLIHYKKVFNNMGFSHLELMNHVVLTYI